MAAPTTAVEGGMALPAEAETCSQRRVNWPVSTTELLIRLWEDNLAALRSNTRNARVYDSMTRDLNARLPAGAVPFTSKQVRQKLENLNKHYRKLRRCGTTTGSKGVEWPYYWLLHSFLGTLPVNDSSLVEESVEVPDVNETPEGVHVLAEFNEALAEDSAGAEDTSTSSLQDEGGTPAAGSSDTSILKDRGTSRKRKRPSTALQEIMELQKQAEERCASMAQQRLAMQQQMLQLQKESNDTQKDILGVLKSYFEGRNKSSVN
ncbi:hypothetical protein HPB50_013030 [Hyalomma asiaticum]|uniref:Uncharacterized protein n=1 Tax=Hyalomma asiaticum TaxID=266040 RepID=A0ACB7RU56_HYAAI|nr:hypothetical protein HPB50_013030 [Hyalomma asiaticum]